MKIIRFNLFLLVSFIFPAVGAHNYNTLIFTEQPIFQQLTTKKGLSQGTINCIVQDMQGFMWFGTMDGLNRYDGYNVKVFRNIHDDSTSISSNIVNQIIEDKNGLLWIATGNGLNTYNPMTNIFKTIHLGTADGSGYCDAINCLAVDQSGLFWIGTQDNGIFCFNPNSGKNQHYFSQADDSKGLYSNSVTTIFADSYNNVWVGFQSGGISMLDPPTGHFTNYLNIPENVNRYNLFYTYTFAQDAENNLLIGTEMSSIISYNYSTKKFKRIGFLDTPINSENVTIRSLAGSNTDTLWIGTDGRGLVSLNRSTGICTTYTQGNSEHSLVYNTIKSLYIDRDKNLWIGTYGKGINILSPCSKLFYSFVQSDTDQWGLTFSSIRSIYEDDDGILWVGGYIGLDRIDLKNGVTTANEKLIVYSICPDPNDKNILWIGTEGAGLSKFNKVSNEFYQSPIRFEQSDNSIVGSAVYEITPEGKDFIYFGTDFGLNIFNTKTGKFNFYAYDVNDSTSLVQGLIISVFIDKKGTVWVGSINGGLARFNKVSGTFTRYSSIPGQPGNITGNRINCIYEARDGRFWVGTNMGLNLMDRESGKFILYSETDGLANNFVYGILEDKHGNLWLSTNKGISKFNPSLKTFTNFDVGDGLPGNEFNTAAFFKKGDDRLYFGGVDGLVVFNPDKIINNTVPPKVVFTRVMKSNREYKTDTVISYLSEITLQPDDLMLTFEYSALNYVNSSNCQYAYMVGNLDNEWISRGNKRSVMLAHLGPGEYIFKVKASNNDGVWSEIPASIKITVLPRIYEKTWFRVLALLLILSSIVAFFIFRISLMKNQKKRLQSLVDIRTRELKDAIDELQDEIEERKKTAEELQDANTTKDKFFSIIAHDLKSPFNSLLGFSELLVDQWSDLDETEKLEFIKRIKKTSESTFDLVTNLLEWSRLQKGTIEFNPVVTNLNRLAKISLDQLQSNADLKEISLNIDIPGALNIFADQNMIDFVIRNLMSNAIKFTPRSGHVFITARNHDNRIVCYVEDNGIGMSREVIDGLFKLENNYSSKGTEGETGTGLGLILCKEFIRKNHGSIWIESESGKGSKFFFSLPVSEHYNSKK